VLPVIRSTSRATVVNVSAQTTLYCLVTGYPLPTVTWNKDGDILDAMCTHTSQVAVQNISMEDRQEIIGPIATRSLTNEMVELGVISVLQINSTERRDTGSYTCMATNALPQTTNLLTTSQQMSLTIVGKSISLNVANAANQCSIFACYYCNPCSAMHSEPPDPPQSTYLSEYGSFWVTIEWETGFDGNLALEQFAIYLNTKESDFVMAVSQTVDLFILAFETISSCASLQKWKGCFNSGRVIPIAASLPKNVNTSKSITLLVHYRSPMQFQTCNG